MVNSEAPWRAPLEVIFVTFIYEAHWLISSFHYTEKNSITCLHLENDSYVVRDACEINKIVYILWKRGKKRSKINQDVEHRLHEKLCYKIQYIVSLFWIVHFFLLALQYSLGFTCTIQINCRFELCLILGYFFVFISCKIKLHVVYAICFTCEIS